MSNNPQCDRILSADGFERLKEKIPQAWEDLVACCEANLSKYILRTLIKANLVSVSVSDIEQKTWETVLKRFTCEEFAWQGVPAFYRWLYSTALNHVRNYTREAHRRDLRLVDPSDYSRRDLSLGFNISIPGPEDTFINDENQQEMAHQ